MSDTPEPADDALLQDERALSQSVAFRVATAGIPAEFISEFFIEMCFNLMHDEPRLVAWIADRQAAAAWALEQRTNHRHGSNGHGRFNRIFHN